MNRALANDRLFEGLMRDFKSRLDNLADTLQDCVGNVIASHLEVVHESLDMIRADNVALESERLPEFRGRVDLQVEAAKVAIKRIQDVVYV
jgi:hypothetical protein